MKPEAWHHFHTLLLTVSLALTILVLGGHGREGWSSDTAREQGSGLWRSSRALLQDGTTADASPPDESSSSAGSFHWSWRPGLMLALTFLVSALSMPAGIGGGIIFVPLNNSLLQLSPSSAAAQSQAFILGGALGSAWMTLSRRHPSDASRPLIDFDILLLLLPLMLIGVALGVVVNDSLANWLITVLLFSVLVWQTYASLAKSLALYRKERAAWRAIKQQQQQQQAALAAAAASSAEAGPQTSGLGTLQLGTSLPLQPPTPESSSSLVPQHLERSCSLPGRPSLQQLERSGSLAGRPSLQQLGRSGSQQLERSSSLVDRLVRFSLSAASYSFGELPNPTSCEPSFQDEECEGDGGELSGPQLSLQPDSGNVLEDSVRQQEGSGGGFQRQQHQLRQQGLQQQLLQQQQQQQRQHSEPPPAPAVAGAFATKGSGGSRVGRQASKELDPSSLELAEGSAAGQGADRDDLIQAVHEHLPSIGEAGEAAAERQPLAAADGGRAGHWEPSPAVPAAKGAAVLPPAPLAGRSSGGSGSSSSSWREAAAGLGRHMAEEVLRLPRFDRPTLRRLATVACIWSSFVAFQVAKGTVASAHYTQCYGGFWALLAVEVALLFAAAAGYLAHIMRQRQRRRQQQQQQELQLQKLEQRRFLQDQDRDREGCLIAAGPAATGAPTADGLVGVRLQQGSCGGKSALAGHGSGRSGRFHSQFESEAAGAAPAKAGGSIAMAAAPTAADAVRAAEAAAEENRSGSGSSLAAGGGHWSWSLRKILVVQGIMLLGGTLATALGLGGGLVVSPLLLQLGVHPLVGSATSSFMVLLTVSAATITYAVQSRLSVDYSLIFGSSCFLGAFLGVAVINYVVRRSGATSLVVFLMTGVVAAGAIICASYSMPKAVEEIQQDGAGQGFTQFCKTP